MNLSGLSWHRSCPGHLWEAAVAWAPAYSAVYLCLCLSIKRRVLQYRVIFFTPWKHSRVPGYPLARVKHRLTSTTQPLCHCARVYHNIHNRENNGKETDNARSPDKTSRGIDYSREIIAVLLRSICSSTTIAVLLRNTVIRISTATLVPDSSIHDIYHCIYTRLFTIAAVPAPESYPRYFVWQLFGVVRDIR